MKISKKSQYGLRALFYLARKKGYCSVREIAQHEDISADYLEKIFFDLERADIIESKRGSLGGYVLALPPAKINLKMILETLENNFNLVECVNEKECDKVKNCPIAPAWKILDKEMKKKLQMINLKSLINKDYEQKSIS